MDMQNLVARDKNANNVYKTHFGTIFKFKKEKMQSLDNNNNLVFT